MNTQTRRHFARVVSALGLLLCLGLVGCSLYRSNLPPVVALDALPHEGYAPLDVSFDASSSFDPEGKALSFQWDLGDGTTATGPTVEHSYHVAGTYEAQVTVLDPDGATSSDTVTIDARSVPDGYVVHRFTWTRDGVPRVWDVLIPYGLYQTDKSRPRVRYGDAYNYGDYVSDPLDDPTLEDYATTLWNRVNQDDEEFVYETLAFVQGAIQYKADPPGEEYPLYPIETLTDGHGDCEDTAILFVSLLYALREAHPEGVDISCKLAFVDTDDDGIPDHVLAFVSIPNRLVPTLVCGDESTVFEWDDIMYAIAETAVDQGVYPLGCDPWGIDESDIAQLWSFPNP